MGRAIGIMCRPSGGSPIEKPHKLCSYNAYVPIWYAVFGEQLRSAVLEVMLRRTTCRLPERHKEADKLVGEKAPNHTRTCFSLPESRSQYSPFLFFFSLLFLFKRNG